VIGDWRLEIGDWRSDFAGATTDMLEIGAPTALAVPSCKAQGTKNKARAMGTGRGWLARSGGL